LIIGPMKTVFYSSYFIFDIFLPSDYPSSPPKVFYNSLGMKLHPNLYDTGTVCLSLLCTWTGSESEQWNPNQSSILQLVVSLQGLILGVKHPYFLEAGYDKQRGTKQGSRSAQLYNERSLLLSLKLMLLSAKNPPVEFKDVILDHFGVHIPVIFQLGKLCSQLLEFSQNKKQDDENKPLICPELKEVADKFYLPIESTSRGFLTPLVRDILPKFESEAQQQQQSNAKQQQSETQQQQSDAKQQQSETQCETQLQQSDAKQQQSDAKQQQSETQQSTENLKTNTNTDGTTNTATSQ